MTFFFLIIAPMSHSVKIYDTCIGCTQCVRACPTDVLEMIPWTGVKLSKLLLLQERKTVLAVRDANPPVQLIS